MTVVDVDIRGAVKLRDTARALRAAGDTGLRKEMLRALRDATHPLAAAIREEIPGSMPSAYAAVLLRSTRVTTKTKATGWPSVTVTALGKGAKEERDLRAVNAGRLRHPVFGRSRPGKRRGERTPSPWVLQAVRGGFFDRAVDTHAGTVRDAVGDALDRIADQIARS
jgi:hypothetical protein